MSYNYHRNIFLYITVLNSMRKLSQKYNEWDTLILCIGNTTIALM